MRQIYGSRLEETKFEEPNYHGRGRSHEIQEWEAYPSVCAGFRRSFTVLTGLKVLTGTSTKIVFQ